jgi:hypothetical protein
MTGNGVLAIFHTKQVESGYEFLKIWHIHALYKVWHSSPLFFSQTMANRILWVFTNFHIPWRSAFFFYYYGYNGLSSSLAKLVTSI